MQSGINIRIYSKIYAIGYKKTTLKSGFDLLRSVTSPVKRINLIFYLSNIKLKPII
jgi:hypothetical protein